MTHRALCPPVGRSGMAGAAWVPQGAGAGLVGPPRDPAAWQRGVLHPFPRRTLPRRVGKNGPVGLCHLNFMVLWGTVHPHGAALGVTAVTWPVPPASVTGLDTSPAFPPPPTADPTQQNRVRRARERLTMFNGDASSSAARNVVRSSSISGEMYNIEKSARGSADSVTVTASKKRRSSLGAKMVAIVGLSQWSKSTLQLNQTGELPRTPPQQRCQPPPELSPLLLGEVHAPGCPKQCSSCLCLMRTPKNASYKCPPPAHRYFSRCQNHLQT